MSRLVFKNPVWSSFYPPKEATVDCDRSEPLPIIDGPRLNQIGLVLFSSIAVQNRSPPVAVLTGCSRFQPVSTGFTTGFTAKLPLYFLYTNYIHMYKIK